MANKYPRDRWINDDFVEFLKNKWPAFRRLADRDQRELAHMLLMHGVKSHAHDVVEAASSHGHRELEQRYGRNRFVQINDTVGAFLLGPWSKNRHYTRSFHLSPMAEALKDTYVKSAMKRPRSSSALDMNGDVIKTLPNAISSKRQDGKTSIKLWRGVKITPAVQIDIEQLQQQYDYDWAEIKRAARGGQSHSLFSSDGSADLDLEKVKRRAFWAAMLVIRATTNLGYGMLPMRYREVESGRLYAMDLNLQNCPSEVRRAALDGCWDYDIENCHFTLLKQMAARIGVSCPQIDEYLANKQPIREALAKRLGVGVERIKTVMVAIMYGARLQVYHDKDGKATTAIYDNLGQEKGEQFIQVPLVQALSQEVRAVGAKVLAAADVRSGSLINAAGCGIRRNRPKDRQLAHLLQGAEAKILKTAVVYLEQQ